MMKGRLRGIGVNLNTVKQSLLARKEELLERHGRITRKTRHRDEPLPQDFAEQAVELENQEVLEALDLEVADELRQIEHALARVEAGDYLYCDTCGEAIPPARLQALPTTSRCVDCATEAERR
jgi:phage/conjugal plasmid C-4 type zinc finger TraR family protein